VKAVAVLALLLGSAAAGGAILEIEAPRVSYFSGYTLYEISGHDLFKSTGGNSLVKWRSRLKFPVNNMAIGGGLGLLFDDTSEFRLRGWTTCDDKAGTMRDDDWLNGMRDIWSRSKADLEAWGVSGEVTWWAARGKNYRFGPRLRLDYDCLDYEVSDVRQWSIYPEGTASVDGLVLTYRQERASFLPGLAGVYAPVSWLELGSSLAVSPFTHVWDEDDHLLRFKVCKMRSFGFAFLGEARADVVLADRVRLGLWGEILYYRSWWARQNQRFYAGEYAGLTFRRIHGDIERQTYMLGARFSVAF